MRMWGKSGYHFICWCSIVVNLVLCSKWIMSWEPLQKPPSSPNIVAIRNWTTLDTAICSRIMGECSPPSETVHLLYSLQGTQQSNYSKTGKVLSVSRKYLDAVDYPTSQFLGQDELHTLQKSLVFVTAVSQNHFNECLDSISSVQQKFPKHRIVLYDLGLLPEQVLQLKRLCHVEYRVFNFQQFPPGVRNLKAYRWKIIIIYVTVREFGAVFWMDSSIRFLDVTHFKHVWRKFVRLNGVLYFMSTDVTVFAYTHPDMFEYLPMEKAFSQNSFMFEHNSVMYGNTRETHDYIIRVLLMCALHEHCMSPPGSSIGYMPVCLDLPRVHRTRFSGCHRFDQSAAHIVNSNYYHHQMGKLLLANTLQNVISIEKYETKYYTPKICDTEQ